MAFIIFSSCGSIQFFQVFKAQRESQRLSFKTTSSILSSQIVDLTKSRSHLKSLVFSCFCFFSFSVCFSSSISFEVIETSLESLYSLNH
jgi:hypothetical protein